MTERKKIEMRRLKRASLILVIMFLLLAGSGILFFPFSGWMADMAQPNHTLSEKLLLARGYIIRIFAGRKNPRYSDNLLKLGDNAWSASQFARAEQYYRQALDLNPDRSTRIKCFSRLSDLYLKNGRYDLAKPLLVKVSRLKAEQYGAESEETASAQLKLGEIFQKSGDYEKAGECYHRALAIYKAGKDNGDNLNVSIVLGKLGDLYRLRGKLEKAESFYRRSLAGWRKNPDTWTKNRYNTYRGLAYLEIERGNLTTGKSLLDSAREEWKKTGSGDTTIEIENLRDLAYLYLKQGRLEKAKQLIRQALSVVEEIPGENILKKSEIMGDLATVFRLECKDEKAIRLLQERLNLCEGNLEPHHPEVGVVLFELAELYDKIGEKRKAENLRMRGAEIQGRALELLPEKSPPGGLPPPAIRFLPYKKFTRKENLLKKAIRTNPEDAGTILELANLYFHHGRYRESISACQRALHLDMKTHGRNHPRVIRELKMLSSLYRVLDENKKAAAYLEKAVEIMEGPSRTDYPGFFQHILILGDLYGEDKNYTTAEEFYRLALKNREEALARARRNLLLCYARLAELELTRGDYEKAENYCLKGLKLCGNDPKCPAPDFYIYMARIKFTRGKHNEGLEYLKSANQSLKKRLEIIGDSEQFNTSVLFGMILSDLKKETRKKGKPEKIIMEKIGLLYSLIEQGKLRNATSLIDEILDMSSEN
ncbi:MAG: tetratricopeptide repeat protein [Candidatus Eremiobacteraeota bacterium]|nr:tetratricopeptide repeat protein [Candidatus Eremiobacteraeota bacterium]